MKKTTAALSCAVGMLFGGLGAGMIGMVTGGIAGFAVGFAYGALLLAYRGPCSEWPLSAKFLSANRRANDFFAFQCYSFGAGQLVQGEVIL